MNELLKSNWFLSLPKSFQDLVSISIDLYEKEKLNKRNYNDYSFVVFPMAKAYEGILKQFFLDMGFITMATYESKRFRIGKALNPDIRDHQKDEYWLFDDLERIVGTAIARQLWDTWLHCRNRVFHYFPKNTEMLSLSDARGCITDLSNSIELLVEYQKNFKKN